MPENQTSMVGKPKLLYLELGLNFICARKKILDLKCPRRFLFSKEASSFRFKTEEYPRFCNRYPRPDTYLNNKPCPKEFSFFETMIWGRIGRQFSSPWFERHFRSPHFDGGWRLG